jgi:hypothetical protein
VFLLAECPLPAQITLPGGPRIPLPGQRKKSKKAQADAAATEEITGLLRRVNLEELILEPVDSRIITIRRLETTKFYKNSTETPTSEFKPGDHLSVEATRDDQGYFYAVTVTWVKAATPEERARASRPVDTSVLSPPSPGKDKDAPPVQRRGDSAPKDTPTDYEAPRITDSGPDAEPEPPTEVRDARPPVRLGADDPGRPVQRRGAPARRATTIEPPSEDAPIEVASAAKAAAEVPAPEPPKPDPVIDKARAAAATFNDKLPNYICQQFTARFQSRSRPVNWRPIDILSAEVIYEDNREHYRNLKINDKPSTKRIEDSGASWSTGEYGSLLADIFDLSTAAQFRRRKDDTIAGVSTVVYDFWVERENSHWSIHAPSQLLRPAYKGAIWIDPRSGRVLRIEIRAVRLPEEFPLDTVESAVDYEYIRLGGPNEFLLPVHAELLNCQRGTSMCSRNTTDFRNYHRYSGESSIIFGK